MQRRRKLNALLQVVLTAECIPAGLSRELGQQVKPCGRCSACLTGAPLRHVPRLGGMHPEQVYAFLLGWQRDALAKKRGCLPRQIMPDAALRQAAQTLAFPPDTAPLPELARLVAHLRKGQG